MAQLEFGLYDTFGQFEMSASPIAADVYDAHIADAQQAEKLGYKYYHIIEHQSSPVGRLSAPNVYLAALAQRTETMRVGVMIYQLPLHHPIRLAQDAAMLDHLSRGRFEFGIGTGVSPHEFLRWNVPFDERKAISLEAMEIIMQAWTEDSVTFEGKYFKYDEALTVPKPYQQPTPPIWYGAHSHDSFVYSAEKNFNVSQNIDRDIVIAEKFEKWRKLWAEQKHEGPMPRTFITRHVHVAETDELAREQAESNLVMSNPSVGDEPGKDSIAETRIGHGAGGRFAGEQGTPERDEIRRVFQECARSYDFWIDNGIAIVGSPETVYKKIEAERQLIGHDIFAARHRFGRLSEELSRKSLRLFGEEVMPAFNGGA